MPELDFTELRRAVEEETSIPEFREVSLRARRHRRWRRFVNTARVLGILVIAAPALAVGDVVFTHISDPQPAKQVASGGGTSAVTGKGAAGLTVPTTRKIIAVDGIDPTHTYALVDVCQGRACNLQLSQVNPSAAAAVTQEYGLLRSTPTDIIIDPRLVVENTSTVIVSGIVGSTPRQDLTLSVNPAGGAISTEARPIQTHAQGPIQVIQGADGVAKPLANQPPVNAPVLANQADGWWVVGTMAGGQLAVSVSHDSGHKWSTHPVGVAANPASASLVTRDGQSVFMLVHSGTTTSLLTSADGGVVWNTQSGQVWPASSGSGMIMATTGELIAWFTSSHGISFLASTDHGVTFDPLTTSAAPSGPIVATGGGFITLGLNPMVSTDGVTWESAYVPYVNPGS